MKDLKELHKLSKSITGKLEKIDSHLNYDIIDVSLAKDNIRFIDHEYDINNMVERAKKRISKSCWSYYIKASGLETLMTEKILKEYRKDLENAPDFTSANAEAFLNNIDDRYIKTIENLFKETFQNLISRRYNDKKSRNNKKVEDFFILGYGCNTDSWSFTRIDNNSVINHLEKIMFLLDGKKPAQHPDRISDLANINKDEKIIETEYLKLKLHKNGNVHVTIKRADLLEKFNQYSGDATKLGNDIKIQKF